MAFCKNKNKIKLKVAHNLLPQTRASAIIRQLCIYTYHFFGSLNSPKSSVCLRIPSDFQFNLKVSSHFISKRKTQCSSNVGQVCLFLTYNLDTTDPAMVPRLLTKSVFGIPVSLSRRFPRGRNIFVYGNTHSSSILCRHILL